MRTYTSSNTRVKALQDIHDDSNITCVMNVIDKSVVETCGIRMNALDKEHYKARLVHIVNGYWLSNRLDFVVDRVIIGRDSISCCYKVEVLSVNHRSETYLYQSETKAELLAKIDGAFDTICDLGL